MSIFEMNDAARQLLVEHLRSIGDCPYSELELTQIVDIAVHSLNEGIARMREAAEISPSPIMSTATAARMFASSVGEFLDMLQAENKKECNCPVCQVERRLGAEFVGEVEVGENGPH